MTSSETKRIKVGPSGVEWERFDRSIAEARQSLAEEDLVVADESVAAIASASRLNPDEVESLLAVSPRAAVVESYVRTEIEFRSVARGAGMNQADEAPFRQVLDWMHVEMLIGTSTYEAAIDLSHTRNEAVHQPQEIDRQRALSFLTVAAELRHRLGLIKLENEDG